MLKEGILNHIYIIYIYIGQEMEISEEDQN
jgi:hypothetical protein